MFIGVACGGTGGHIFPGLAVAETLRGRGHRVALWMAGKDIEGEAMNEWSGEVITVPSQGFQGRNLLAHLRASHLLWLSARHCRKIMESDRPDALVAMGSYASIGPGLSAKKTSVPLVLHEANVIPGRAVKFLSRHADVVALSFEETSYYLTHSHTETTGMPLRPPIQKAAEQFSRGRRDDSRFCLLVMGGSGGAHSLNDICSRAVCRMHGRGVEMEVIHLTGHQDEAEVAARYDDAGVASEVVAFSHDMPSLYARADMAVCRAGASTCAELNAFLLPALLVPYPFAVKQHQMRNAEVMEQRGCANLIDQSDLSEEWLAAYLTECISDGDKLDKMHRHAQRHRVTTGAAALADLVEIRARTD